MAPLPGLALGGAKRPASYGPFLNNTYGGGRVNHFQHTGRCQQSSPEQRTRERRDSGKGVHSRERFASAACFSLVQHRQQCGRGGGSGGGARHFTLALSPFLKLTNHPGVNRASALHQSPGDDKRTHAHTHAHASTSMVTLATIRHPGIVYALLLQL